MKGYGGHLSNSGPQRIVLAVFPNLAPERVS